jgi:hypothetical protein
VKGGDDLKKKGGKDHGLIGKSGDCYSGIGRGTALALVKAGAGVVLAGTMKNSIEKVIVDTTLTYFY